MSSPAGPAPPSFSLTTPRLTLRLPTASDAPACTIIANSPLNNTYLSHFIANPPTITSTLAWFDSSLSNFHTEPRKGCFLIIEETSTGTILGDSGVASISPEKKQGEMGVMINHPSTGRGYAVEALWASANWGFEAGLERIEIGTDKQNKGMRGVAEGVFGLETVEVEGRKGVEYWVTREAWVGGMEGRVRKWLEGKWMKEGVVFDGSLYAVATR